MKSSLAKNLGLQHARVLQLATHDTASAAAGTPLEEGFAYISSGPWSFIGVERDRPLIDMNTASPNFTNEGGAFSTIPFLKNAMGLSISESCRREWSAQGVDIDYSRVQRSLDVQHDYFNHATANATALPVCAGPVEATAIGNILVQATRAGRLKCLSEARNYFTTNIRLKRFVRCSTSSWEEAAHRYAMIEAHYAKSL